MKMKVLITGTSQGIGRAICQLFLDKGYDINFQPEGTNTFLSEVCLYNYSNKEFTWFLFLRYIRLYLYLF